MGSQTNAVLFHHCAGQVEDLSAVLPTPNSAVAVEDLLHRLGVGDQALVAKDAVKKLIIESWPIGRLKPDSAEVQISVEPNVSVALLITREFTVLVSEPGILLR